MSKTTIGIGVIIIIFAAIAMGQTQPNNPPKKWEYGQYIATFVPASNGGSLRGERQFRWVTATEDVKETGESFRLFKKIGIQIPNVPHADHVLWNHLGKQGWEFMGIYTSESASITVFRREF